VDELVIIGAVALAPFYVMGVVAAAHVVKGLTQSAVETKLTETVPESTLTK